MALVDPTELGQYLQVPVQVDAAMLAIRVAEGWLRPVAPALHPWPPDPVPEDLWAWALELAAIAYSNPTSQRIRTVGEQTDEWSEVRRGQILADVAARFGGVTAHPLFSFPAPLFSFPPPATPL